METQTPFDLNLAIQSWREELARSSAFRGENLNELESHLRDSIDRLRTPQLSDEEAFLIATRRVGNAQRLEQEFGKVNSAAVWFDRCLWVLVAVQLWTLVSSTSSLLLAGASLLSARLNDTLPGFGLPKIEEQFMQTALAVGFSPLFTAVFAILMWRLFIWPKRKGSAVLQKLLRQPAGLALGLFLVCLIFQLVGTWALQAWYYPSAFRNVSQMRLLYWRLPSMVLWAGLTFFVARKRLRSMRA